MTIEEVACAAVLMWAAVVTALVVALWKAW